MNLTRFPLFFPEKRAFFLQDTSYFNFGGLQGPPMPFFTRKIGLSNDGEPIDIIGGMKLSGRTGPMSFGFDVQTHSFDNVASKNLAVGRTMLDVGKESSAGLIFAHGNSLGPGDNTLGGVDFHYKDSNVLGSDQVIEANGYMMHSEGASPAMPWASGYFIRTSNGALNFDQIGQGFDPALGFIDRPGIRVYEAWLGPEWRPTGFDHMLVWPYIYMRTDLDAASSTACCGSPSSSLKRRAAITSCSPPSLPKSSSSSLSISCRASRSSRASTPTGAIVLVSTPPRPAPSAPRSVSCRGNAKGKVIAEKQETFTDLSYLQIADPYYTYNDPLRYEKAMIRRCFNERFAITSDDRNSEYLARISHRSYGRRPYSWYNMFWINMLFRHTRTAL